MAYVTNEAVAANCPNINTEKLLLLIPDSIIQATNKVNTKIAGTYAIPISDEDAPVELKDAVLNLASAETLLKAYQDIGFDKTYLDLYETYSKRGYEAIGDLIEARQRYSHLTPQAVENTANVLILIPPPTVNQCRRENFLNNLNRYL